MALERASGEPAFHLAGDETDDGAAIVRDEADESCGDGGVPHPFPGVLGA